MTACPILATADLNESVAVSFMVISMAIALITLASATVAANNRTASMGPGCMIGLDMKHSCVGCSSMLGRMRASSKRHPLQKPRPSTGRAGRRDALPLGPSPTREHLVTPCLTAQSPRHARFGLSHGDMANKAHMHGTNANL